MSSPRTPTVISLEWDFCYHSVLVNRTPGVLGVEQLDPLELGLSEGLRTRLSILLDHNECTHGYWVQKSMDERWQPTEAEAEQERRDDAELHAEALDLAYAVQHELGRDVEVLLYGRPLKEHRR